VTIQRRALALAPNNPELLNDLGWALTENGEFEEAEQVLRQAVALAPPDYDRPRNNLEVFGHIMSQVAQIPRETEREMMVSVIRPRAKPH
jgi:Flp pilus assembly protein TadD